MMFARIRIGILLPALVALLPGIAMAESSATALAPGVRVRLDAGDPGGRPSVGVLERADADSLIFRAEGPRAVAPRRLAWGQVRRLEVHAGRRSQTWKGAGRGMGAGMIIGAALIGNDGPSIVPGAVTIAVGAGLGALGGLICGSLVGAVWRTDRWESVRAPGGEVSLTCLRAPNGGMGMGIVLRR